MKNKVAIIGLGYVGLPLALLCKEKDLDVVGIDIDKEKINSIKEIQVTNNYEFIKDCNIILVCVPTPVNKNYFPDLKLLINSIECIAKNLQNEQLIIIESTINPMGCEEIIKPILDKTNKKYYFAYCPERVDPGNLKWNVKNLARVLGAIDKESLEKAHRFYKTILDSEITLTSSIKATEAVKIMENTFRDINIAFVNEMAKSFDKLGIDITEVIKGASTKPFGFLPHYPGCEIGGHCIPIDPYYLIQRAKDNGFEHEFLRLARKINDSMPYYTIQRTIEALNEINKSIKGTRITILGISYKADVEDTRESPSFKIIEELKKLGADLKIYDPYVPKLSNVNNIKEALDTDCVILATSHKEFLDLDYNNIKVVVDGRNALDDNKIKSLGIIYKGIGK